MHYRQLGKTDLRVSAIGLGGWPFGNGTDWGPVDIAAATATICAALETGINIIDTAPIYGQSEELIGQALRGGRRQQTILATKCGLVKNGSWTDHDLRPATITRQLESSLRRLQTDYIDLYFIHYLDPHTPWQVALELLAQYKQQGKIRHIGVCNIPPETLPDIASTGLISCVQEELSCLHTAKYTALQAICHTYQLGFMAYGSLCGGILSGKYLKEPNFRRADARNYFYKCYRGDPFLRAQTVVNRLKQQAAQYHISPAEAALAWVLAQPNVTCALTGAKTPEQILQNARAAHFTEHTEELCNLLS